MYIFFDLDGTLLDSLPDITLSLNKALELNNLKTITLDKARACLGHGSINLVTKASDNNFSDKLYSDYKAIYHNNLTNLSKEFNDVSKTLNYLKTKGFILGIYSNKDEEDVKLISDYYFKDLFTYSFGKRKEYPLKPDPKFLLEFINDNKINKDEFYYIGDMLADKLLANNLGVKFIYCEYGYSNQLIESDITITKFSDLVNIL